ncbi:MAG TPA: hypothetical protein DE179_04550 [Oceanospirillaceae bacterium]|nr:hypothetical protein [Oceanospirillaceae bacterium]
MATDHYQQLALTGWAQLPASAELKAWQKHTLPIAIQRMQAPDLKQWWRYQNTWFAGVNALPNDATGAVAKGPSLPTGLLKQLTNYVDCTELALDQAQISACLPGYPQASASESSASFQYRKQRYAAHFDGLRPLGPERRRHLTEQHSFILGIPLSSHLPEAGPVMVWPGSHKLVQAWLQTELAQVPEQHWSEKDITDGYQLVRRHILETIQPEPIYAPLGGAYLIHRHALHGQGLWPKNTANVGKNGRIIAYFRPLLHTPHNWLCNN